MFFYSGFPVVISAVAVIMDLTSARVDNGWVAFSLCIDFLGRILAEGGAGALGFLAGAVLPALLLWALFLFHMLGAGDIKLFCALGGIMGPCSIGWCILISIFLGAGISLALLISSGCISQRFHYFITYFQEFALTGRKPPYLKKDIRAVENFHFTVPVFLSVVLYAGGMY